MEKCPLHYAMSLIGGKWKVQILCSVTNAGTIRYNALRAKLDGISNTVLVSSLRELERDGLILRREYLEVPVRVEYAPTEDCRRLLPILEQLSDWAEARMPEIDGATTKKGGTAMTIQEALEKLQSYERPPSPCTTPPGSCTTTAPPPPPRGRRSCGAAPWVSSPAWAMSSPPPRRRWRCSAPSWRTVRSWTPVTRRRAEELWRDYDRTHRVPVAEYVAYQELSAKSDAVWHEAKEKNDFALFEPLSPADV